MISREHRFHGRNSLNYVYKNGQQVRNRGFSLRYSLNPSRSSYRLAVVVSRKVNKSAVARNRLRRRFYELIRELEPAIKQPYDLVITVFDESVERQEPAALSSQFSQLLKTAGII